MEMPQSNKSFEVCLPKAVRLDSCLDSSNISTFMMFIFLTTTINISAHLIKVNYRLFLLDVYGVQYDDYEVKTLLPLLHRNCSCLKRILINIENSVIHDLIFDRTDKISDNIS